VYDSVRDAWVLEDMLAVSLLVLSKMSAKEEAYPRSVFILKMLCAAGFLGDASLE
jgi:hypothetical protein